MSNKNRPRLSLKGEANALTTEPTQRPPVEINADLSKERSMEASQETMPAAPAETTGPTAKQMAAAEEANALRMKRLAEQQQQEPEPASTPISDVAARGYDALHEAFRQHNEKTARKKEYVPPPRTEKQMANLNEELEAGARAVARAQAQREASQPNRVDVRKEGFTTPVYRPGDVVPDPIVNKQAGFVGGTRGFSPDV